ncbi:MAG: hypothetical protein Q9160_007040 [Pyrenula sp. 1 TL-2023]
MSYQGYGQSQGGGNYGQYNPYAQQDDRYGPPGNYSQGQGGYGQQQPQGGYDRPQAQQQGSSYYADPEQGQGNGNYGMSLSSLLTICLICGLEMSNINGGRPTDQYSVLNETKEIDRGIDAIEANLDRLRGLQSRYLNDTDASSNSPIRRELDSMSAETMTLYRSFVGRIRNIKSNPESGSPMNAPQVGKVDRRLKKAIEQYQQVDREFRRNLTAQMERQYRIVRPEATDAEVREAVEDTDNQQVFSQALISSDRRGQAQRVAQEVRGRHQAIQKIEKDMIELAQLFQDMEAMVVQQEPQVDMIEQKGQEVEQNMTQANTEIQHAVKSAAAARRKKWWCLGIVVLILIIIAVIVVIVVEVTKK